MGGFPLRKIGRAIGDFLKGADMVLLLLCIVTTIFGIVIISSATESEGSARYVMVQSVALVLGILIYVVLSAGGCGHHRRTARDSSDFFPALHRLPQVLGHLRRDRQPKLAGYPAPAHERPARRGVQNLLYHHPGQEHERLAKPPLLSDHHRQAGAFDGGVFPGDRLRLQ